MLQLNFNLLLFYYDLKNVHLLHILFNVKLFPLRSFVPVPYLLVSLVSLAAPGKGDGGNEPVGEDTYFFFPLNLRINFFALSMMFTQCFVILIKM